MIGLYKIMTGCYFNKSMTDRHTDVRTDRQLEGKKLRKSELRKGIYF